VVKEGLKISFSETQVLQTHLEKQAYLSWRS